MKAVRHFGIVVNNMEKSLHFYRDLLGLKVKADALEEGEFIDAILGLQKTKVRTIKMLADEGNTLVELLWFQSYPSKKKGNDKIFNIGFSHLALTVRDIDQMYEKLKEEGIKFNSSPQKSPDGKVKVAFCRDFDGLPVELVEEIN